MVTFIIIVLILCAIASPADNKNQKTYTQPKQLSHKERKKMQKQIDRAGMDAWEDMIMYLEVFSDD